MSAPEVTDIESARDLSPLGIDTLVPTVNRRRPARYVFLALGLAVYAVAVWWIGWRKIGDTLAAAELPLVAAAAALIGGGSLLRMWKWRRALGAERNAIGLFFLSRSGGVWSPARVGEFLPLLWRRHRNTRVAGWILFDRVLEVLVTLVLGLAGLAALQFLPTGELVAATLGAITVATAGVYVLTRSDLLQAAANRAPDGSWLRSALSALAGTSGEMKSFLGSPMDLTALTVLAKAMDLFAIVLIFRALHASASFALVAAAKCALAVVSYVPITPVSTGIPHGVQGWIMFEAAQIQPETVVASVGIEAAIMAVVFSLTALAATRAIRDAAL